MNVCVFKSDLVFFHLIESTLSQEKGESDEEKPRNKKDIIQSHIGNSVVSESILHFFAKCVDISSSSFPQLIFRVDFSQLSA